MSDTVVIAGGGAAGLMLSCELGLAGVPSIVLERDPEPRTSSCGMLLHARSVDALRRRGIADRFRDEHTPFWPRTHFALLWLDLSTVGETDYDLIVPQWRTEQLLAERAVELGVDIRRGHQVVGVEQDEDGVTVTVRSAGGEEQVRGAYLVGCDGENSQVAKFAGFEFDELAPSYYGVQADVPVDPTKDHFHAGVFPNGQFGALPVNPDNPGEVRLMTVEFFREPQDPDIPVTTDELRASIKRITGTEPEFGEPRWIVRYGSPTRLARNYRVGRVLLAGDAAHPHPPSSGNGLNTAMLDAVNLGWKLAATVSDRAPADLLDTYHQERHPVGHKACMRALAQVPLQYPPDHVGPLRELFADLLKIEEVNRYLVQVVTHVRIAVPGVPPHALLGEVLPDATLSTPDGPVNSAEVMVDGHGVLLDLSGGAATLPDLAEWAGRVDLVRAVPTDEIDAKVLLVRPDGHIVWVDPVGTDHEGLRVALKTWFG